MITISIVSGSRQHYMEKCLETLKPALEGLSWQLVVVDNHSAWDVAHVVHQVFPSAKIIRNEILRGFGANHNQALLDQEDEFALVLNDDIELRPDSIQNLLCFAEKNPKAAAVGPVLYPGSWEAAPMPCGGMQQERIPKPLHGMMSMILRLIFGPIVIAEYLKVREGKFKPENSKRGYISGACCLVRRNFIREHGLYDEQFYMYYEDIDLGRRVWKAGLECWQVESSRVMHLGGGSFNEKTWKWFSESARAFARKHHGLFTVFLTDFLNSCFQGLYHFKGWLRGGH